MIRFLFRAYIEIRRRVSLILAILVAVILVAYLLIHLPSMFDTAYAHSPKAHTLK